LREVWLEVEEDQIKCNFENFTTTVPHKEKEIEISKLPKNWSKQTGLEWNRTKKKM